MRCPVLKHEATLCRNLRSDNVQFFVGKLTLPVRPMNGREVYTSVQGGMRSDPLRQKRSDRRRQRLNRETSSYWVAYAIVLVIGAALMIFVLI